MKRIISLFVLLLFVVGCGGGSGLSEEDLPDYQVYVGYCEDLPYLPLEERTKLICDENGYVKEEYRVEEPTAQFSPDERESARALGKGEAYDCNFRSSPNHSTNFQCRFTPPRSDNSDNFEVCPGADELELYSNLVYGGFEKKRRIRLI